MDWGDSMMIDHDTVITATPARHFSGRGNNWPERNVMVIICNKKVRIIIIFSSGADSGWFPGFKDIGDSCMALLI